MLTQDVSIQPSVLIPDGAGRDQKWVKVIEAKTLECLEAGVPRLRGPDRLKAELQTRCRTITPILQFWITPLISFFPFLRSVG